MRSSTLVVGLAGILLPHFVLSSAELAHGSERCPPHVLVGELGKERARERGGCVCVSVCVLVDRIEKDESQELSLNM